MHTHSLPLGEGSDGLQEGALLWGRRQDLEMLRMPPMAEAAEAEDRSDHLQALPTALWEGGCRKENVCSVDLSRLQPDPENIVPSSPSCVISGISDAFIKATFMYTITTLRSLDKYNCHKFSYIVTR